MELMCGHAKHTNNLEDSLNVRVRFMHDYIKWILINFRMKKFFPSFTAVIDVCEWIQNIPKSITNSFFFLLNQHIELPPVYICVVMTINFFRIIRIDDRCFWIEVKFVIAEKVFCEHAGEHGEFCITFFFKKIFFRLRNLHFQIPIFNYFINYYLPLKWFHFWKSHCHFSIFLLEIVFNKDFLTLTGLNLPELFFIIFIHFPSQSFLIHLFFISCHGT